MFNILKSNKAESLAELLVAILITGMSSFLMATFFSVSINLNSQAEEGDTLFYEEMNAAEEGDIKSSLTNCKFIISLPSSATEKSTFEIAVFGEDSEDAVIAFGKK